MKIYMCVFGVLEWKEGDKFKLIFKHYLVNSVLIVESVRRKKIKEIFKQGNKNSRSRCGMTTNINHDRAMSIRSSFIKN